MNWSHRNGGKVVGEVRGEAAPAANWTLEEADADEVGVSWFCEVREGGKPAYGPRR